jgi:hypothetical protein
MEGNSGEWVNYAPELVDVEVVFEISRVELHHIMLCLISLWNTAHLISGSGGLFVDRGWWPPKLQLRSQELEGESQENSGGVL